MSVGANPPEAGGTASAREPHWHAGLAVLAILGLYVTLPNALTFGPTWVLPVLTLALLLPLTLVAPHRHGNEYGWQRPVSLVMIALINIANAISLYLLVEYLLHGGKAGGDELLIASIKIWLTNVLIFALWYWELDRGGPGARRRKHKARGGADDRDAVPIAKLPDFLFPQMQMKAADGGPLRWHARFVDYLYVSFTNATAFSPTDTLPLTPWAKLLMLVQALVSLLTVALVAARAVNILS